MANISNNDATASFRILADTATSRQEKLEKYVHVPAIQIQSHDKFDSTSPIFDSFYHSGWSRFITDMINVSPRLLNSIWHAVEPTVLTSCNVGTGCKSEFHGKKT